MCMMDCGHPVECYDGVDTDECGWCADIRRLERDTTTAPVPLCRFGQGDKMTIYNPPPRRSWWSWSLAWFYEEVD